jgi:hypothetical protein
MSNGCCGIVFINDSICEIDDGLIAIRLPITEVKRVVLGYGFQSPHPLLQMILGLVFIGMGVFAALAFLNFLIQGGTFPRLGAGLIAFGFIGVWLLAKAVNRGFYLDVYSAQGRRRLGFDDEASPQKMKDFLPTLARTLRVPVTSTVPGITP